METRIAIELRAFLARTSFSQSELARASGVNPTYISRLKTGVQRDIFSAYADALRDAMHHLITSPATQPEPPGGEEGSHTS